MLLTEKNGVTTPLVSRPYRVLDYYLVLNTTEHLILESLIVPVSRYDITRSFSVLVVDGNAAFTNKCVCD